MAEETRAGIVRVGPAGWSYEDWKGIVYGPEVPRQIHPLRFLSAYFDTVEINATFYRPNDPKHAERWIREVEANETFMFTAKLWDRFTHKRQAWPDESEVAAYRVGLQPLVDAGKLGAVLLQFPWSFKRTDDSRRWLGRIVETFRDYPLAIELRHDSWCRDEVYAGLREASIAFCNIDQPLFERSIEPTALVTAPLGYVRLHGRNHDAWFDDSAHRDERYNYLYSEDELAPWLARIETIRGLAGDTYAVTNNHFRGQAIVNAIELQRALNRPLPDLPQHLLDEYPRLKRVFR